MGGRSIGRRRTRGTSTLAAVVVALAAVVVAPIPSRALTVQPVASGAGPHVRTFTLDGDAASAGPEFLAYDGAFRGGVHVAAGDLDGDGDDEIVTGAGYSGGPHVRVFGLDGTARHDGFLVYSASFTGQTMVALPEIITTIRARGYRMEAMCV